MKRHILISKNNTAALQGFWRLQYSKWDGRWCEERKLCSDRSLLGVVVSWSLVIIMPPSKRVFFLVGAAEFDQEAVPGVQDHSQHFRTVAFCLLLPLLKDPSLHPNTADSPLGKGEVLLGFAVLQKSYEGGEEKERSNKEIQMRQKKNSSICIDDIHIYLYRHIFMGEGCSFMFLNVLRCFVVIINIFWNKRNSLLLGQIKSLILYQCRISVSC